MAPTGGKKGVGGGDTSKGQFKPRDGRITRQSLSGFTPAQIRALSAAASSSLESSNRYASLTDNEDMIVEQMSASAARKKKNPPIIIAGKNVSAVQQMLNEVITSQKFEVKLMRIGIRVVVGDKTEYDQLISHLLLKKINYFGYHSAESRPRKIVLYGLNSMPVDDLKKLLAEKDVNPTEVKMLRLRNNHYCYDKQSVYLLYFEASSGVKLNELRNIKSINNIVVKWEKYQTKGHDQVAQCRNCQMFGHSSALCHMPTRCQVCSGSHQTMSCPKKVPRATLDHLKASGKEPEKDYVKCANCDGNHVSSFKGCVARKSFIDVQQKFNRSKQNGRRTTPPPPILDKVNFPSLGPSTSDNVRAWSNVVIRDNEAAQFNLSQQMQLMTNMMNTVNNMLSKLAQMIEVLTRSIPLAAAAPSSTASTATK